MAERVLGSAGAGLVLSAGICGDESTACPYPDHDRNAVGPDPSEVTDPRPAAFARFPSIGEGIVGTASAPDGSTHDAANRVSSRWSIPLREDR